MNNIEGIRDEDKTKIDTIAQQSHNNIEDINSLLPEIRHKIAEKIVKDVISSPEKDAYTGKLLGILMMKLLN